MWLGLALLCILSPLTPANLSPSPYLTRWLKRIRFHPASIAEHGASAFTTVLHRSVSLGIGIGAAVDSATGTAPSSLALQLPPRESQSEAGAASASVSASPRGWVPTRARSATTPLGHLARVVSYQRAGAEAPAAAAMPAEAEGAHEAAVLAVLTLDEFDD